MKQIIKYMLCLMLGMMILCTAASAVNITVDDAERIAAVSTQSHKVEKGKTLKILAIGNSFTNDTMRFVYDIAESAGYDVKVGVLWKGSQTLKDHFNYISNNTKIYNYTLFQKPQLDILEPSKPDYGMFEDKIEEEPIDNHASAYDVFGSERWDLVFIQQASYDNGNPASFYDENGVSYITQLTQLIKAGVNNPKISFAWLMGWAYGQDYHSNKFTQYYGGDQMTMYNAISDTMRTIIWPTGQFDIIIPVGTAVQNVRSSYIGDNLTRDSGLHLNYSIGRYTAGLTVAQSIGVDLKKVKFIPGGSIRVSEVHIPMLREAARAAVKNPFKVTQSSYPDTTHIRSAKIYAVKNTASGISFKWNEVKGANAYYIYRKGADGQWKNIAVSGMRSAVHGYTDRKTVHGVKYYYKVCIRFDNRIPLIESAGRSMVYVQCPDIIGVSSAKKGTLAVKWTTENARYEIRYAKNSLMKKAKTVKVKENKHKTVIRGLESDKDYIIQIRSIVKNEGKTYKSAWSPMWSCKVK